MCVCVDVCVCEGGGGVNCCGLCWHSPITGAHSLSHIFLKESVRAGPHSEADL